MRRLIALLAIALSACASHPVRQQESVPERAPLGVVIPANVPSGTNYHGVIVGSRGDSGVWLAPDAILRLRKDRVADYVALVFWVPNSTDRERQWFDGHRMAVSSRLGGKELQRRCCFDGGVHSVHFSLPRELRETRGVIDVPVHIEGAVALHDVEPTINEQRRLGVVLMRAFFYSLHASP